MPYQVSVQLYGEHFCGGTIINKKYILTAAHCTFGFDHKAYTIRYGSSKHATGGHVIHVRTIMEHPNYNDESVNYDVAILELKKDIYFSHASRIIDMADEEPLEGEDLLVTGWGDTSENGFSPSKLLGVKVPAVSRKHCRDIYGDITKQMICAGRPEGGKDACQVKYLHHFCVCVYIDKRKTIYWYIQLLSKLISIYGNNLIWSCVR